MKRLVGRLWLIDLLLFLLISIGLLNLYSTSLHTTLGWDSPVVRQTIFVGVGLVLYLIISFLDYNLSRTVVIQLLGLGIIIALLLGLFIFGRDVNGTHRWYQLGGFLFQPSEYAKVMLVFWTAFWLTTEGWSEKFRLMAIGGVVALSTVLILVEPDLGTTIISLLMVSVMLGTMYYRNQIFQTLALSTLTYGGLIGYVVFALGLHLLPWWWGVALALGVIAMLTTAWVAIRQFTLLRWTGWSVLAVVSLIIIGLGAWNFVLRDYQKDRFTKYFNQSQAEANFQVTQARIAIGSGQWLGKGLGQGTQSRLNFLPEFQTDFMFAAFVEEWGFVGGLLLVGIYLVMLIRLLFLALGLADCYAQLLVIGLTTKLWVEVFVNLSMNMGLIPTKGIPLPFVSYGGSAILSGFIILAIVQSVSRYRTGRAITAHSLLAEE